MPLFTRPKPSDDLSRSRRALIEFSMALGGFAIGISEFSPMGLMTDIANDVNISEFQVGHLISAYALGVMVGAPVLAIAGARLLRHQLLILLMGLFAVGNIASAVAADYDLLLVCRFIAGMPHGAYFGVIALVASSLAPANGRAKAVSRVMLGIAFAMLFGSPLATRLGQLTDWRYVFGLVGLLSLFTLVMIFAFLPRNPDEQRSSALGELKSLVNLNIWIALAIASIGFAGMFCVFSYLAPTMLNVTMTEPEWIPVGLGMLGLGGIIGNIVGGWLFDRAGYHSLGIILAWATVTLLIYPQMTGTLPTILLGCLLVGTMIAMTPALQTHLMDIAEGGQTLVAASNHSAFNLANALGPWLSGIAVAAGYGWSSVGYVGAAMTITALLIYFIGAALLKKKAGQVG
ncbi:MAG: MFS transporter [Oceanospirillaceae bacterium]|uniref:MFS transporter n=1 Tax=unclassified Thalassolituus TaxID=2624967 RepID=UPI000C4AC50B|nr:MULTISPECIES: MFS transporter [unclassified Thalassolituus]MAS26326.1 MFS transporter [Oceanospirillaceae bacterium]MAY00338.1 MFS transporter [Oceanospirillaceae bacterium]MBL34901.1 MFS transporter [Oceanospirillaceae bacterium]MBS51940.1 MFS transporter [Oceanospirillaceae bacterium]|tara:strand:+ start:199 stop:1407 length:1209 start_codon:yes stop_codon:yes gene_type:complete